MQSQHVQGVDPQQDSHSLEPYFFCTCVDADRRGILHADIDAFAPSLPDSAPRLEYGCNAAVQCICDTDKSLDLIKPPFNAGAQTTDCAYRAHLELLLWTLKNDGRLLALNSCCTRNTSTLKRSPANTAMNNSEAVVIQTSLTLSSNQRMLYPEDPMAKVPSFCQCRDVDVRVTKVAYFFLLRLFVGILCTVFACRQGS